MTAAERISAGATYLGIELGSTRIKASLIGEDFVPLASGSYEWENRLENGYWTYSLEEIHRGVKGCYADLSAHVRKQYGVALASVRAIGVSGMMHGYLAFDKDWNLLTPFRTWRNTVTGEAVYHAAVLEEVAAMNLQTLALHPSAAAMPRALLDKHYLRKHGKNAYYGQN